MSAAETIHEFEVETVPTSNVRAAVATIVGTTIEWYDFFIFGTASALIFNKVFFPSFDPLVGTIVSLSTFAVGLFARPIGKQHAAVPFSDDESDQGSKISRLRSRHADPNSKVPEFNKKYTEVTGAPPSSQYVYPGYVLIDVWAKAVQRSGSTDTAKVTLELEKMKDEPTLFGPRTFTNEIHHQNRGRYLIVETKAGKPAVVDEWTISKAIPVGDLLK